MSEISNLNYTSSGKNLRTNYIMNTYPEGSKYYHKENIVSKDQDGKEVYHTAEQEYSVSYDEGGSGIKLDSLLDDLKNERNLPTAITITETRPGLTNTTLSKNTNTNVYKSKSSYNENLSSAYNVNTIPERNPCIDCNESHKLHDDLLLQDQFFSAKNLENHNTSTKKVISSGLTKDVKEIALVDDILPVPGTKVTTTVRTYTYEIPNHIVVKSLPLDQNENQVYGDRRHNIIETTNIQNKFYSQNTNASNKSSPLIIPNEMETDRTFYYKNISSNARNVVHHEHSTDGNFPKTTYELDKNTHLNENGRFPANSPISLPSPFPIDEVDKLNKNNNPPKRLDDLMATFENDKSHSSYQESWQDGSKVELDTAIASPGKPPIESRTLSKNMQGPPVFYPPGQEMFARKEEMSGGYRAQGRAAQASGRYEYGAESSSKSKKSSGAAVVPVCLPLCCAMPCSIM